MAYSRKLKQLLKILFILQLCFPQFSEGSPIDVIIKEFSYKVHQKSYFEFLNISEQILNQRKSIHFEVEFAKPLMAFDAQVVLSRFRKGNSPFMFLNVTINGCQSLNSAVKNRVFKTIMNAIQYGNSSFPKRCPLQAHKRFVIDQFYLHPKDIEFFPAGFRYLGNLTWIVQKKPIISLNMDVVSKH